MFYFNVFKVLNFVDQWVMKFENEYEVYYKKASDDVFENIDDVEAAFEALHKQSESEYQLQYASKKFDNCIPQHTLLNTSFNKNKCKINHRKSFRGNKFVDSSDSSTVNNVVSTETNLKNSNNNQEIISCPHPDLQDRHSRTRNFLDLGIYYIG